MFGFKTHCLLYLVMEDACQTQTCNTSNTHLQVVTPVCIMQGFTYTDTLGTTLNSIRTYVTPPLLPLFSCDAGCWGWGVCVMAITESQLWDWKILCLQATESILHEKLSLFCLLPVRHGGNSPSPKEGLYVGYFNKMINYLTKLGKDCWNQMGRATFF